MKKHQIIPVWGRILQGYQPFLSLEITKECPLKCPGCYAYDANHLNNGSTLHQLSDSKGDDLVSRVLELIERHRPLHLSIVGGEPLVRFRELSVLLPKLQAMNIEVQLVTSAVRPIPREWADLSILHLAVSVDGLPPEHDVRRAPATYERIRQNIKGHKVIIHCTITRQMLSRPGYLREFTEYWCDVPETRNVWFSIFTPQEGDNPAERLTAQDRERVLAELDELQSKYDKLYLPDVVLEGYKRPPVSPDECLFAQTTKCLSSDFSTAVTPCQIGGRPKCDECGCMASAGLAAVGRFKLAGLVSIFDIFSASAKFGERFGHRRNGSAPRG